MVTLQQHASHLATTIIFNHVLAPRGIKIAISNRNVNEILQPLVHPSCSERRPPVMSNFKSTSPALNDSIVKQFVKHLWLYAIESKESLKRFFIIEFC